MFLFLLYKVEKDEILDFFNMSGKIENVLMIYIFYN